MKHVTVLGYGSMGRRHAMNAIALDYAVSVYDADIAKAATWEADHHAAKAAGRPFTYRSMFGNQGNEAEDVWRWECDAVIIATPAAQHVEDFWRAATACPAVFMEKPVGLTAEGMLRDSATLEGRLLNVPGAGKFKSPTWQVGYNLRHHVGFRHLIGRGLPMVGTPLAARVSLSCDASTWPGGLYASTLLECSHEIDLALWMFGPASVAGASSTADGHVWEILLSHESGSTTSIRLDDRYKGYARGGVLYGTDGMLRWGWDPEDKSEPWMFRWSVTPQGNKRPTVQHARAVTPDMTYAAELMAFFIAAKAGLPGDPSVEDGLAVLRVAETASMAALVSAWNRRSAAPAVQG